MRGPSWDAIKTTRNRRKNLVLRPVYQRESRSTQTLLAFVLFSPAALVIIGGRGLSGVRIGPLYFYDAVVGASIAAAVYLWHFHYRGKINAPNALTFLAVGLVPATAVVKLLYSEWTRVSFVDFHPFAMLVLSLTIGFVLPKLNSRHVRLGFTWIFLALQIAVALTAVRILLRLAQITSETDSGSRFLNLRPDYDGLLLAVAGIWVLWKFRYSHRAWRLASFFYWTTTQIGVALLGSRAAQLAGLLMFLLFQFLVLSDRKLNVRRKILNLVMSTSSAVIVFYFSFFLTPLGPQYIETLAPVNRIVNTQSGDPLMGEALVLPDSAPVTLEENEAANPFYSVEPENNVAGSGIGTVRSRLASWKAIWSWLWSEPSRLLLGVGFGTDYFFESGGRENLMGDGPRVEGENRFPHNFALSIAVTLGLPVACYFLLGLGFVTALSCIRSIKVNDEMGFPVLTLLIGLSFISFFGVVFETSFGAVLFASAIGWVIGVFLKERGNNAARNH